MKKLFALVLSLVMMLSLAVPCAAAEETAPDWSGMNVTPVNPMMGLTPYGTDYPQERHYPHPGADGPLSIKGNAAYSMLWLEKMILGCNGYTIYIVNNADTTLTGDIRRETSGDIHFSIAPGGSFEKTIDALPDEIVCMSFDAPSNFRGSLSCACH